jgi:hypothetical protein
MLRLTPPFLRRRRIVLHVGLPKCGSTSIQRHMAENDVLHRARGVCYPLSHRTADGYRNHLPLARMAPGDLASAVQDIMAEAQGCHTVVLSCEHWSNALPNGNIAALCEALAQGMPRWDLRVVAYFRNPFNFVESCYAQYVLAGLFQISRNRFYTDGAPSIDKFLTQFEAMRGFALWSNLGWAQLLQTHVPKGALSLRSMEAPDLRDGGIVADFCTLARMPRPAPAPRANTRPSNRKLAELEYVQTLIDQDTYAALRGQLLTHEFSRLPEADHRRSRTLHIGPDLAEVIAGRTREDRAPLARMFATRTSALCAVPACDWARHEVLNERDRANLASFVARHVIET